MRQRLKPGKDWLKYEIISVKNWWISVTFGTFEVMLTNWPEVQVKEKKYITERYSNDDLD